MDGTLNGRSARRERVEDGGRGLPHPREAELVAMLAADGKLVRRPVLVAGDRVLVGFRPEEYDALLG